MSYSVNNNVISMTRGDTCKIKIEIFDYFGEPYIPDSDDKIRFAMGKKYNEEPLIRKDIDPSSMLLIINPEDTKQLSFGSYVYDMELTTKSGEVDTFIPKGSFIITEEVI